MKIRKACTLDAACLAGIELCQPLSAQWGEKGFVGEVNNAASCIWCAEEENEIHGFVALRHAAGFCEILNVAVVPSFCRQGLAYHLMSHALAELRVQGGEEVTLEVNFKNIAAISLYSKLGFEERGRRKKFYNGVDDALIMGMSL